MGRGELHALRRCRRERGLQLEVVELLLRGAVRRAHVIAGARRIGLGRRLAVVQRLPGALRATALLQPRPLRLLHGSAPNRSAKPRTLFICVYSAEDAIPLSPNPLPSTHEGRIVHGERTGRVRCVANELKLPQLPKQASFFAQQAATYDG